jgi:hypothetical protein
MHRRVAWTGELVSELRDVADVVWNALKRRRTMQALMAEREALRRRTLMPSSQNPSRPTRSGR